MNTIWISKDELTHILNWMKENNSDYIRIASNPGPLWHTTYFGNPHDEMHKVPLSDNDVGNF